MAKNTPDQKTMLQSLLGLLRAMFISHHTSHLIVSGPAFYAQHGMFNDFYTGVVGDIDGLAEKMVAMYGPGVVDPIHSLKLAGKWLGDWPHEKPLEAALQAENELQQAIKDLRATDKLDIGLDNFLCQLADDHQTNIYKLQQTRR